MLASLLIAAAACTRALPSPFAAGPAITSAALWTWEGRTLQDAPEVTEPAVLDSLRAILGRARWQRPDVTAPSGRFAVRLRHDSTTVGIVHVCENCLVGIAMSREPGEPVLLSLTPAEHAAFVRWFGAAAAEHPATAVARAFYRWYEMAPEQGGAGFRFDRAATERAALFTAELRTLLDADGAAAAANPAEIVGLDFDPLTASQDPCEHYEPQLAVGTGARVQVPVRAECSIAAGRPVALTLEFVRVGDAWQVADVVFNDGDRLTLLLGRLAAARRTR